jgi:CubicO group peptidase (beta-lactamase class C family)
MLVDEGKVDLDAKVSRYLPRFRLATEEATDAITVRSLLTHEHGLNSFPIVYLDAFTGEITEDRFYRFLAEVEPRGQVAYSNLHFTLVGRIIEAVSGKPWRVFLEERIFAPAGMTRTTGFADQMYAREDVAFPTLYRDGEHVFCPVRKTDRTMHAAGGLGTSARDGARWLLLNLQGGTIGGKRLLSEKRARDMQVLHARNESAIGQVARDGYGLAWAVGTWEGRRALEHGGGYAASSARFTFLPDDGIGVVVLVNGDGPAGSFADQITGDVLAAFTGVEVEDGLPGLIRVERRQRPRRERSLPRGTNPAEEEGGLSLGREAYAGTYAHDDWGTVTLTVEDGRLTGRAGDLPVTLFSRGRDEVRVILGLDQEATGAFRIDGDKVVGLELELPAAAVVFRRR